MKEKMMEQRDASQDLASFEESREDSTDATGKIKTNITFVPGEINIEEKPETKVSQGIGNTDEEVSIDEQIPTDFTVEDCEMLCNSVINLPSLFAGAYLVRTPEQVKPFAFELYKYCQKKGIDPLSYFFDEFGMMMTGAVLAGGMYKDFQKHKEYEKKKEEEEINEE